MREADSLVENLKSRGTHESSSVGPDDTRFNSDVLTDKEDRWEPENSSVENEIYHTSKRKAGSSESCDSGRPGPSKGRDESSDFDSEVYYYSKIGWEKGEKSDRVTHSEHGKSRRKSRNKDRKLDSDDRPRQGSSQSSHRRHSSGLDDATDSSDGDKESVRKHKRHHAGHRSRDHKRPRYVGCETVFSSFFSKGEHLVASHGYPSLPLLPDHKFGFHTSSRIPTRMQKHGQKQ
ncbi:uncharacterized protein [Malus domestica]|uniref:uncharacterized protein isoform X2 n=1 Tax=Malus domestica TaxID=3750 RepID=UPI003974FD1A